MKVSLKTHLQTEPSSIPLFELHMDLTQMTEREFTNALTLISEISPKFDVVLRKP